MFLPYCSRNAVHIHTQYAYYVNLKTHLGDR